MNESSIDEIKAELSRLLAAAREEKGISKRKLSEKSGLTRFTIGFIENPEKNPTINSLLSYALALDVDLGKLISKAKTNVGNGADHSKGRK